MFEPRFRLIPARHAQPPVVLVSGDVDLASVDDFAGILAQACTDAEAVTVDLRAVTYCDSAALRVLFAAAEHTTLVVTVRESGALRSLLNISGLDRIITVNLIH